MPFTENAGLRYFQFEIFPPQLIQAVYTRRGGVSPTPWNTLNVGGTVGDDQARVRENRRRSFEAVGRQLDSMFDVWQVHSAQVVTARAPRSAAEAHARADVILTDRPEITLYMRFADCVPVLLHDPVKGVVGIVHAGWLGTVRGATPAAVQAMVSTYGSKPAHIQAAIGPSIGVDHYQVGSDVLEQVAQAFGAAADRLVSVREGKPYLDLWASNELQLRQAGVQNIEVAGICTACHTQDWYSHRREKGVTGRFGALIALPR